MKPIVPPKYNIGFILKNTTLQLLEALEPWCSNVYTDCDIGESSDYIAEEQMKSSFNLIERIQSYNSEKNNEILVEIDGTSFNQQDMQLISQLPEILQDSGEIGSFELGNLKITINKLDTYENKLIKCKK